MCRASSVLWLQIVTVTCKACISCTVWRYTFTRCTIHTPYRSQYAAIALTTPCTSFTQILLTKRVIFSQALTLAPWRWFLCKPKHVGAFWSNLECFSNSAFLTFCASVGNKRGFSIVDARYNHEVKRRSPKSSKRKCRCRTLILVCKFWIHNIWRHFRVVPHEILNLYCQGQIYCEDNEA